MKIEKHNRFRCIAFCGGIATGKSTLARSVAERLARNGFTPFLLDFDQLRRISFLDVERNRKLCRVLKSAGTSTLSNPREISRYVLKDPRRMIEVGDILAEEIAHRLHSQINSDPKTIILIEWPGPLPAVLHSQFVTDLVTVTCPVKEQLRRLVSGDLPLVEIRRRIRMQGRVVRLREGGHEQLPELLIDTSHIEVNEGAEKVLQWITDSQNRIVSRQSSPTFNFHISNPKIVAHNLITGERSRRSA